MLALPFKSIAEGLKHLKDSFVTSITNLGSFIVNGIKSLFVPSENFFNSYLGSMKTTLDSKLPIVSQLKTLLDTFVDNFLNSNPAPPKFSFVYKGVECVLIDFSMYSQYRLYIHGFILVTSYYFFIIKVYKFLPRLLGGIT